MDRTYVVTGSASGIGAATVRHLAEAGARVIGCDLHDAEVIADLATDAGGVASPGARAGELSAASVAGANRGVGGRLVAARAEGAERRVAVGVRLENELDAQDRTRRDQERQECLDARVGAEAVDALPGRDADARHEALMLDPDGFVSSCNATNFFFVADGEVHTSTGAFCFNGITRANVIALCQRHDIAVRLGDFTLQYGQIEKLKADAAGIQKSIEEVLARRPGTAGIPERLKTAPPWREAAEQTLAKYVADLQKEFTRIDKPVVVAPDVTPDRPRITPSGGSN